MKPREVRFWTYENGGAVRIKLPLGRTLAHSSWARTEEGWSSEWVRWTLMTSDVGADYVLQEWGSDGVDCDGRLRTGGESMCPVADLEAGYFDETGFLDEERLSYPKWQNAKRWQRDESAEAMGY